MCANQKRRVCRSRWEMPTLATLEDQFFLRTFHSLGSSICTQQQQQKSRWNLCTGLNATFNECKTWMWTVLSRVGQIVPAPEALSIEYLADHTASKILQHPPTQRKWSGEAAAAAEKHQPLLHKARSKFGQLKQFLSSLVRLTLLIGWMCEVVALERLS